MNTIELNDLQESIVDPEGFSVLSDYGLITKCFLDFIDRTEPTLIVSPTFSKYHFYQYSSDFENKITRPLNFDLFITSSADFNESFASFESLISEIRLHQDRILSMDSFQDILNSNKINQVIYTIQQTIGCIGDSFTNANRARKRSGQLFENLIKILIQNIGLECEEKTIQIPIPRTDGLKMKYQLDLVISDGNSIVTAENSFIQPSEIIGSVKTTSKDRIDKIFIDKYMLSNFLGQDLRYFAIFLHDVQRAKRGESIFGIAATFKTNHFIGYSETLNELDGVYYIDPLPHMLSDIGLKSRISNFQQLITSDIWKMVRN